MKKGLTELTGQLAAMWKQLGINQRVSLGLATGALLVGVVALALLSGRVSWALLYGGLDDTETAKVIAVLEETKIAYQVRGPGSVYVPAGQKYAARMQLSDKGILREGQGYELFDGSSFGVSDFLQRLNKKRAIEGELARTIMQMDAVEEARVQVPMEENTFLVDPQRKLTASVMVKARGAARLSESAVNSIQLTVANSVLGLEAGRVSVVDSRGEVLGGDDDATSAVGLSGGQLRARQELEDYLSRKAERMLTQVLGPGNATVTVNAEINWDTQTTYEEKYDPDGQVPRSETVDDEETSESPAAGEGWRAWLQTPCRTAPTPLPARAHPKKSSPQKRPSRTANMTCRGPSAVCCKALEACNG